MVFFSVVYQRNYFIFLQRVCKNESVVEILVLTAILKITQDAWWIVIVRYKPLILTSVLKKKLSIHWSKLQKCS